jgi:hypothetical protein
MTQETHENRPMRSQQEVSAFASMIVTSLPFPPLPVLVLQGEDGEYGMASSFDLLQQGIIVQQLGCVPVGDLVASKESILNQLRVDMCQHYEQAVSGNGKESICSSQWLQKAYDIYCNAFRSYFLNNYATTSQDLRFCDVDAVPDCSTLVYQGTSHWKASRMLSGDSADDLTTAAFCNYSQMLRSYAVDLATLDPGTDA